jgi:hypothetical protein
MCINGYWTNFHNKFSLALIEDIPRFVQYYVDNGFIATRRPGGPIYFIDGKCISYNAAVEGDPFEFHFDKRDLLKTNGKLNVPVVTKALRKNPQVIHDIPAELVTGKLLYIIREYMEANYQNVLSINLKASADLWVFLWRYVSHETTEISAVKFFFEKQYHCTESDLANIMAEKFYADKKCNISELNALRYIFDKMIPECMINSKEKCMVYLYGEYYDSLKYRYYSSKENGKIDQLRRLCKNLTSLSTLEYIRTHVDTTVVSQEEVDEFYEEKKKFLFSHPDIIKE